MASINLLLFGRLSSELHTSHERIELDNLPLSVSELRDTLQKRNSEWSNALASKDIKFAINQTLASEEQLVNDGDEVAIFPPVTGG